VRVREAGEIGERVHTGMAFLNERRFQEPRRARPDATKQRVESRARTHVARQPGIGVADGVVGTLLLETSETLGGRHDGLLSSMELWALLARPAMGGQQEHERGGKRVLPDAPSACQS
jgi:hypothetical protein